MRPFNLAHLTLSAPPAESIAAAKAAGFDALGIRIAPRRPDEPYPVQVIGAPATIRAIREQARDAGVTIANVQAYQFFPDTRDQDMRAMIDATHALGVRTILAYSFDPDEARFLERFGRYCDTARAAGIHIAVEFLPYSQIRDLSGALQIIEKSGATNAGVCIDALHLHRSGGSVSDVRRLDPNRISLVQLCDARQSDRPMSGQELMTEARTGRLPLGAGILPLFDLLDALPADVEIEYELAPAERAGMSPLDKARAARADLARFARAYDAHCARR